jgi:PAS domain S-box-containing protein
VPDLARDSATAPRAAPDDHIAVLYTYDPAGSPVWVSPHIVDLLGITAEEALTVSWLDYLHPDDRPRLELEWSRALEQELPHESEYRIRHRDGSYVRVRCVETLARDPDGAVSARHGVVMRVREVRGRERELELQSALERQRHVADLGQDALRGMAVDRLRWRAVDVVRAALGLELCGVLEYEPDAHELVMRAGVGWSAGAVDRLRFPVTPDTQVGAIMASGSPVTVADVRKETRLRFSPETLAMGVLSSVGVRIPGPDAPLGVIGALSTKPRTFLPDELAFMQAIANVLGASWALERSERARNAALEALVGSAEQERARIATELHDDTVQVMTATLLSLDRVTRSARARGDEAVAESVEDARRMLTAAVERTRHLMFELRPPLLASAGLVAAIEQLLAELEAESGIDAAIEAGIPRLPETVESLGYRTIVELLSNVRRHAGAAHVEVTLAVEDGALRGVVVDDGSGFVVQNALDRRRKALHLGLDAATQRLRLAGGDLQIDSTVGSGSRVSFRVPIPPGDAAA